MPLGVGSPPEGGNGEHHKTLASDAWWPESEPYRDGFWLLVIFVVLWVLVWICLFYLVRRLQPLWMSRWNFSFKPHENDPNWCARCAFGMLHSVLVSVISLPALVIYIPAPSQAKFGAAYHLADCALEKSQSAIYDWDPAGRATALAGLAFISFTLADLIISTVHGLSKEEQWLHHGAYILAGLLIRFHCMLPFNASIMMCMEASTPFLNYCLLFRHRDPTHGHRQTFNICTIIFLVAFSIFRIILNTYGAILLCLNYNRAMPPWVPLYQNVLLLVAIVVGALMQYRLVPTLYNVVLEGMTRKTSRKSKDRADP